ncbi:MAG: AlwI family type II restriction endonuclease, partial [Clostridiales bacterium]|nr:AlwI family type II restriction endonuclease [Clostridiales bacterium]
MKKRPWLFGNTTIRNPLRIHDVMAALKEYPKPFSVTKAGLRLAGADDIAERQECFLRALACTLVPSIIEPNFQGNRFCPFRFVISLALALKQNTGSSFITFSEMAGIVQFRNSEASINKVCKEILTHRNCRVKSKNKHKYDHKFISESAKLYGYAAKTPGDYADTNIRYLKATGLFCAHGHGIALVPHRECLAELLAESFIMPETDDQYLDLISNGASLPVDDKQMSWQEWVGLSHRLTENGIDLRIHITPNSDVEDIRHACYRADALLTERRENDYAARQRYEWPEIIQYMHEMAGKTKNAKIPMAERAAYLEWVLWRSFLAINSLVNPPHQARRFPVDVDFLPVSTAPDNGPDMIFEFKDFVLVVEVTLTESSRQEACEGEPVRRHVAECAKIYSGKPLYGLFVAVKIDTNTAETFRIGTWYYADDQRATLSVVPVSLNDFATFLQNCFENNEPAIMRL